MRGFAGLLSPEPRRRETALCEEMRTALGPRAAFSHGSVQTSALCVVAGSIKPAIGGAVSPIRQGEWVAVSDARLDDRSILAERLGCEDDEDSVVLNAYRRWGEDCVNHLRGEFAFMIWDPERECLFLARDRFGVRPLYYAAGRGWFAFASQAAALLELPDLDRSCSELRIAEFLEGDIPPADQAFVSGISRLPAGHTATVEASGVRVREYWQWTLPEPASEHDLPERLAELFTQAVARRVPGSGPAVTTLSGGLDSSAIAVTMARLPRYQQERTPAYSLVFDDRSVFSERDYIESVLSTGAFDPHFLSLDIEDPFDGFDARLKAHGGLFLAPNLAMGKDLLGGLPAGAVVLNGHGGDEVLSHGYELFHEMAQDGRWLKFCREAVGASGGQPVKALRMTLSYYLGYSKGHPRVRHILKRLFFGSGANARGPVDSVISDHLRDLAAARRQPGESSFDATSRGRARHMATLADPMQQYALEILDRNAAASGLELRFPFWDQDLIEFMLAVPADQKLRGGRTRSLMRRAMKGRLPDKVRLRRDKHDFSHHLILGLRASEATSRSRFDHQADRLARYLNLASVEEMRSRVLQGPFDGVGMSAQLLWRAAAVAEWLEYADRNGIEIVE